MRAEPHSRVHEAQPKEMPSGAQVIGAKREIEYTRRSSLKDKAELALALGCLMALLAAFGFSEIDDPAARLRGTLGSLAHRQGAVLTGGRTILVVASDDAARLIAKTTLERYGYGVELADNASEAVGVFRKSPYRFGMVLLDEPAALRSSVDVIQQFQHVRPRIPILVARAAGEELPAGAAGQIPKPLAALPLAEAVRTIFGK